MEKIRNVICENSFQFDDFVVLGLSILSVGIKIKCNQLPHSLTRRMFIRSFSLFYS